MYTKKCRGLAQRRLTRITTNEATLRPSRGCEGLSLDWQPFRGIIGVTRRCDYAAYPNPTLAIDRPAHPDHRLQRQPLWRRGRPHPHPPDPEAEQPTYTVRRGTVPRSLEFTARVAPVQQSDSPHLTAVLAEDARL